MDHKENLHEIITNLRIVRNLDVIADSNTKEVTIKGRVRSFYHKQLVGNAAIQQNIWLVINNGVEVD